MSCPRKISLMKLVPNTLKHLLSLGTILTLSLVAPIALAEKADRNKPLQIEADRGEMNEASLVRTLTGNVVMTKGTLRIRADRVVIREDAQGFAFVTATGKTATFRQKREGLDEFIEGQAERVEYDGKQETVKLIQRAQLRRLNKETVADEVFGQQINYDSKTEFYTVEGGSGGQTSQNPSGRVRIVLQPKSTDPQVSPAPAPGKSEPRK